MVIAMAVMGMMKMVIDQVVDMFAVRHGFMSAPGAMRVLLGMSLALMFRSAIFGIGIRYTDYMFVDMVIMGMVQVAIVQIIDMTIMHDARVSTFRAVRMNMVFVMWQSTIGHLHSP